MSEKENNVVLSKVIEQLGGLYDLASKIDNSTNTLSRDLGRLDTKVEKIVSEQHRINLELELLKKSSIQEDVEILKDKMHKTEIILQTMDISIESNKNKWNNVLDTVWKIATTLVTAFLLWKLGLGSS